MNTNTFILAAVVAAPALAQTQVLVQNYADLPASEVPGYAPLRWKPAIGAAFDKPAVSPNGQHWLVRATSEETSPLSDTFLIAGTGVSTSYFIVVREGDIIPQTDSTGLIQTDESFGVFRPRRAVNDAGQIAFSTPGRNTPSAQNDIVLRALLTPTGSTNWTVMAREAQTLNVPGYNFNAGQFTDGVSLAADGRVMWVSQRTPGFPILDPREGIFLGNGSSNTLIAQTIDGTNSIPTNQTTTSNAPWRSFSIQFATDAAGTSTLVLGFISIGNIDTLAFNNNVLMQESSPLPGRPSAFVATINPTSVGLSPGTIGTPKWFCRGTVVGGSYAVVNGNTVAYADAAGGTPVACGNERWSNRAGNVANIAANDRGDYILTGGTDDLTRAPGDEGGTSLEGYIRDEVLVANGRTVLLREGDQLDLDNNPATDHYCTITDFEADTAVLTNDGTCYIVVALARPTAIPEQPILIGSALIRVAVPHLCPADLGTQGGLPGQDGNLDNNDFVVYITDFFTQHPCADVGTQGGLPGSDGNYDNNDFVVYVNQFFAGC